MSGDDAIFLLGNDGTLEKVPHQRYRSEDVLQELIARHPELLVGEQIDPDDPPRWLLVSREAAVPDQEAGADRWYCDHLLLDHAGVPTLVEAKRSSDRRIRREVIGQMLEYAANATRYWPTDRIRTAAAEQYGGAEELDRRITRLIEPVTPGAGPMDTETYWKVVDQNLHSGNVRLLFVADELPKELRRVIEFLNEQMHRVEVLGVELRQYAGASVRALVPRVVGQTERIREERSATRPRTATSRAEFLERCPAWSREFFVQILDEAARRERPLYWGAKGVSIRAPRPSGRLVSLLYCYPPGAHNHTTPWLDVYLKFVTKDDGSELLRAQLVQLGFREYGEYSLDFDITPESQPRAQAAMPHIWHILDRISERQ